MKMKMKMKNKGFTLVELLVVGAICFCLLGIVINAFTEAKRKAKVINHSQTNPIKLGDTVVIDGLNVTGKVNQVRNSYGNENIFGPAYYADVLIISTNGIPTILEKVHVLLLKKLPDKIER